MKCECCDVGCHATSVCQREAESIGFRVDMADRLGTAFCQSCADDAAESGLFRFRSIESFSADQDEIDEWWIEDAMNGRR